MRIILSLCALLIAVSMTSAAGQTYYKKPKHTYYKTPKVELKKLSTFAGGSFDEGAAEIVAYDSDTQRLFVTNGEEDRVDVLDISDPYNISFKGAIDLSSVDPNGSPNSVAVCNGVVAVAIEADDFDANGNVGFYDSSSLELLGYAEVGVLPDMVTFTPNCKYALTANEGEPNDDYTEDPEGSVSIIDLHYGPHYAKVKTADFAKFDGKEKLLNKFGIRIFGPNASTSQDVEPEYIAVSKDSRLAYVSLQENNAMAVIDIKRAKVIKLRSFGLQKHSKVPLDASDRDGKINIQTWPRLVGMHQPDTIAAYTYRGKTYVVTANEGDARDYDGFSEEQDVDGIKLDPDAFPNAAELQKEENLGRLDITTVNGDKDNDGYYEKLFAYGSRSFSIYNAYGHSVFNSGDDFEQITAKTLGLNAFNTDNDEFVPNDETRSDKKGPEPEGLALGKIHGRTYAFIGLERVGGIMVYDITNPYRVKFQSYFNDRDYSIVNDDESSEGQGDLAPEGLSFISAYESPTGKPMLAVSYEISGTTVLYEVDISYKNNKPW